MSRSTFLARNEPRALATAVHPANAARELGRARCWVGELPLGISVALAAVLLCAGCASNPAATSRPGPDREYRVSAAPQPGSDGGYAFSVPFVYADSLGVGAGAVEGSVALTRQSEAQTVSRAIVLALQELQNSVIEPNLNAGEVLPQKKPWSSDRAPVAASRILGHNAQYPDMKLPPRYYGVLYTGNYTIERRQLVFRVSARLYERAAASDWRPYSDPYSGTYFVDALGKLIETKLRELTKANPQ